MGMRLCLSDNSVPITFSKVDMLTGLKTENFARCPCYYSCRTLINHEYHYACGVAGR